MRRWTADNNVQWWVTEDESKVLIDDGEGVGYVRLTRDDLVAMLKALHSDMGLGVYVGVYERGDV